MLQRSFYALVALSLVQTIYYYPQMPAILASNFDGAGAAHGWSSRNGFFGLYLAMIALLVLVFGLLPRWTEKRGSKLPNRDFWLAPERADETRAFVRRQMLISGIAHLLLAIGVIQLAIQANFSASPRLSSSFILLLLIYFVFLLGWLAHFLCRFRRPG